MKKRMICAFFAASLMATASLAGCSGGDASVAQPSAASAKEDAAGKEEQPSQADASAASGDALLGSFNLTKEGRVKVDCSSMDVTSSGLIYVKDGKYGVITPDGKKDTGAVYAYAKEISGEGYNKGYVVVRALSSDNDNVNTCGLIDKDGNEVVPCKYASAKMLNERYVYLITADQITTDKDKALVYYTDKTISFSPSDGDTLYTGKWEVFDVVTNAMLKGVTGTLSTRVTAQGQFVTYKDDKNTEYTMDAAGQLVTDGRKILSNGAYVLEVNGKSAVYTTDDKPLFSFNAKDYSVSRYAEPYYVAVKTDSDYNTISFLLNEQGETVSAEFKHLNDVTSDFVLSDETIYHLDGTKAFNDHYTILRTDKVFKDVYSAHKDKLYTVFDKNGNVLFTGNEETDNFEGNDFYFYKKGDSASQYYNFKDCTYNIEGSVVGDWFVKRRSGSVYELFETRTGGKLLESSYGNFDAVVGNVDNKQYIYAYNSINGNVANGDFDVFSVTLK